MVLYNEWKGGISIISNNNDGIGIVTELQKNVEKGIHLYLDGQPATPWEIAQSCVKEESAYMPDYVLDEAGVLKEVRYDKVFLK